MTFGERLRELREDRDLTQKSIAEILNVSPRMVGFYESGDSFLSDETQIIKLAHFFGVTTDYLLGNSDAKKWGQMSKMKGIFEKLSESDRKTALDFLEFLEARSKKRT